MIHHESKVNLKEMNRWNRMVFSSKFVAIEPKHDDKVLTPWQKERTKWRKTGEL